MLKSATMRSGQPNLSPFRRGIFPAVLAILCFFSPVSNAAAEDRLPEYQLKMVFLYKFAKFVQWPEEAFADAKSPIIIGILGKDPFGPEFDKAIEGRTAYGRSIQLRRFTPDDAFEECHILFVSSSLKEDLKTLIEQLERQPVLTVSDISGFPQAGGMVNLIIKKEQLRMQINLEAAQHADLRISSRLLKMVDIYKPPKKQEVHTQP